MVSEFLNKAVKKKEKEKNSPEMVAHPNYSNTK